MNKRYLSIIICILLMVIAVSGCGKSDFPTGTFSIEGGYYKFEFTEGGEGLRYEDDSLMSQGTFSVRGDELTWKSHSFCAKKATYIWTYENDALTFTLKGEDTCAARVFFLDNRTVYQE